MKRAAMILTMMLLMMNSALWVQGFIGEDEMPTIYKHLPPGLQKLNPDADFQDNLILVNDEDVTIFDEGLGSFVTNEIFNFIRNIPIFGGLLTLVLAAIELVLTSTFGITLVAMKIGLPINWVIFVGILNFAVVMFGALELLRGIISAFFGGGAT